MKNAITSAIVAIGFGVVMASSAIQAAGLTAAEIAQVQAAVENEKGEAVRAREPGIIAASGGRIARSGDNMTFALKNGQPLTLYTQRLCFGMAANDTNCVEYNLVNDLASQGVYVLQKALYTRTDYVLLDGQAGKQTVLSGLPQFSPDGQRFIIIGFDNADDGETNALQIWRREKDGAVMEWSMPYGNLQLGYVASAKVVGWDGLSITLEFDPGSSGKPKWRGSLKKSGATWSLAKL